MKKSTLYTLVSVALGAVVLYMVYEWYMKNKAVSTPPATGSTPAASTTGSTATTTSTPTTAPADIATAYAAWVAGGKVGLPPGSFAGVAITPPASTVTTSTTASTASTVVSSPVISSSSTTTSGATTGAISSSAASGGVVGKVGTTSTILTSKPVSAAPAKITAFTATPVKRMF